jgi:hypothetical protein
MHVIPSFMFQPVHGYRDEEFCVRHNIRREFYEELFGATAPDDAVYNWFEAREPVRYLDELLARGDAEIWLTGLTVDLRKMRPEICALLRIKTPEWFAHHSSALADRGELIMIPTARISHGYGSMRWIRTGSPPSRHNESGRSCSPWCGRFLAGDRRSPRHRRSRWGLH